MLKPKHKSWNKFSNKGNSNKKTGKLWTPKELSLLKELALKNKSTGLIASELGRTKNSVYLKASGKGINIQYHKKNNLKNKNNYDKNGD